MAFLDFFDISDDDEQDLHGSPHTPTVDPKVPHPHEPHQIRFRPPPTVRSGLFLSSALPHRPEYTESFYFSHLKTLLPFSFSPPIQLLDSSSFTEETSVKVLHQFSRTTPFTKSPGLGLFSSGFLSRLSKTKNTNSRDFDFGEYDPHNLQSFSGIFGSLSHIDDDVYIQVYGSPEDDELPSHFTTKTSSTSEPQKPKNLTPRRAVQLAHWYSFGKFGRPKLQKRAAKYLDFVINNITSTAEDLHTAFRALLPLRLATMGSWRSKTTRCLEKSAERGNRDAQFDLAMIYLYGSPRLEIPINYQKACTWFRRSARQGHLEAMFQLTLLLLEDSIPISCRPFSDPFQMAVMSNDERRSQLSHFPTSSGPDEAAAKSRQHLASFWARYGSYLGYPGCMVNFGMCMMHGIGILEGKPNFGGAVAWFYIAAKEYLYPDALYNLAACIVTGIGNIVPSHRDAFYLIATAATSGHPQSCWILYLYYSENSGVAYLNDLSIHYLALAAENGLPIAQYRLSRIYSERDMKSPSMESRISCFLWMRSAAYQGHLDAMMKTAEMYFYGKGTPSSELSALCWMYEIRRVLNFLVTSASRNVSSIKSSSAGISFSPILSKRDQHDIQERLLYLAHVIDTTGETNFSLEKFIANEETIFNSKSGESGSDDEEEEEEETNEPSSSSSFNSHEVHGESSQNNRFTDLAKNFHSIRKKRIRIKPENLGSLHIHIDSKRPFLNLFMNPLFEFKQRGTNLGYVGQHLQPRKKFKPNK